jgi:hypothetical protein
MAPTYRNDSTIKTYRVTNTSGEAVNVLPGESVASYDQSQVGLTKVSDDPYYNPTLSWDTIVVAAAGSGESSAINPELVSEIEVYSRGVSSGEALVHLNSIANGVTARIQPGRSVILEAEAVHNRVSKVWISSTLGSIVEVVARKEAP